MSDTLAPKQLSTSFNRWSLATPVDSDELYPDYIADVAKVALDDLLDQAFQRMVALDWSTVAARVEHRGDSAFFTVSADVLR